MALPEDHHHRGRRAQGTHHKRSLSWKYTGLTCAYTHTQVHPNTAQCGNGAIETAAVLVNALLRVLDRKPTAPPSDENIDVAFAEAQDRRFSRAAACLEQGRRTSSLSLRDATASRLVVHFLLPWFGDSIIMWLAVRHAGSAASGAEGRGKVPWRPGAFGVGVAAALLYFYGRPEWPGSLATVLGSQLGHL